VILNVCSRLLQVKISRQCVNGSWVNRVAKFVRVMGLDCESGPVIRQPEMWRNKFSLTLYGYIKTAEQRTILKVIQQYGDWYTDR